MANVAVNTGCVHKLAQKHKAQMGVHKLLYQMHKETWNAVYERTIVALCAHSPTVGGQCKMGAN